MAPRPSFVSDRAIHGLGRVGFGPNPDSTHRHRVEGWRNPKSTVRIISRFGFECWLASVGPGRLSELKKALKFEKKRVAGIWNFRRKLEKSRRKLDFLFIYEICIFFG